MQIGPSSLCNLFFIVSRFDPHISSALCHDNTHTAKKRIECCGEQWMKREPWIMKLLFANDRCFGCVLNGECVPVLNQ
jgi:hypothetical protein